MRETPAFPMRWTNETGDNAICPDGRLVPPGQSVAILGMTLRDWFAGKAMAAIIAADPNFQLTAETASKWAYEQADAMLAEREKRNA